jgi:hypothetical protein
VIRALEFKPVRSQNQWVDVMFLTAGISLLDFKLQHIPGEKHAGPDGLLQRPHAPEDDDNEEESVEEVEDWIDKVLGCMIWSKKDLEWTFPELKNDAVLTLHSANHPDHEIPPDNTSHQCNEELQTIHSFLDNLSFPLTLSDVERSWLTKHAHQFFMQGQCLWCKNPAGHYQLVLFGPD